MSLQTNVTEDATVSVLGCWKYCMNSSLDRPQLEARPHSTDCTEASTQHNACVGGHFRHSASIALQVAAAI